MSDYVPIPSSSGQDNGAESDGSSSESYVTVSERTAQTDSNSEDSSDDDERKTWITVGSTSSHSVLSLDSMSSFMESLDNLLVQMVAVKLDSVGINYFRYGDQLHVEKGNKNLVLRIIDGELLQIYKYKKPRHLRPRLTRPKKRSHRTGARNHSHSV